ncbi:MAG TPA: LppP/LprE family lipoprotein [Conexibacter sp.]|nr:LppP/LprE family lipoprotein [Conexibacter sp.]
MPSRRRILSALAPAALALLVLAGCGGDDEPTSASVETTTVTRTVTAPATTSTDSAPTTPSPPPDPDAPLSLQTAEQVLDGRGYAPLSERDWRPDQPLKVLLGVARSADPRAEQAFFFVGDAFIGTDTKDPSASIEVTAQDDDSVTLSYALYRPADAIDSPSGGTAEVTYAWNGTRLVPQDPIPSAASDAPLSRR